MQHGVLPFRLACTGMKIQAHFDQQYQEIVVPGTFLLGTERLLWPAVIANQANDLRESKKKEKRLHKNI